MLRGRRDELGNVFALLFGAVALVGVLGKASMDTLTGPVTTSQRVTQKARAESDMLNAANVLVRAAGTADADNDGFTEARPFRAATGPAPVGGGWLPNDLGLALTDPYGTPYGLCVWDHGSATASTGRLAGDNTATAATQTVLALIAAGPDRTFQTSCAAYSGGAVTPARAGDDLVQAYSYSMAAAQGGGLWTLNPSDANRAELRDGTGTATVTVDRSGGLLAALALQTGLISATAASDDTISVSGGLLLDTSDGTATTCENGLAGSLRLNDARTRLEICDGTGWAVFKAAPDAPGSDTQIAFNDNGTLAGASSLTWNNATTELFVGPVTPAQPDGPRRLHVTGEDSSTALLLERYGGPGKLTFASAMGTIENPTPPGQGNYIGQFLAKAYQGGWGTDSMGSVEGAIAFQMTGNGSDASHMGTRYRLLLKEDGTTTTVARVQVEDDGIQYHYSPTVYVERNTENTSPATLMLRKSRGAWGAAAQAAGGDYIGAIGFSVRTAAGYGTATQNASEAYIAARLISGATLADAANAETYLTFSTKATGSATSAERVRMTAAGVTIGGLTTARSMLHVNGAVQPADDVAACVSNKNGAIRYSSATLQVCRGTTWENVASQAAPRTWGRVTAAGSLTAGANTSAAANGAGLYTLTWTTAQPNASYGVTATPLMTGLTPYTVQVVSTATGSAQVQCFAAGSPADCAFSFQVIAN